MDVAGGAAKAKAAAAGRKGNRGQTLRAQQAVSFLFSPHIVGSSTMMTRMTMMMTEICVRVVDFVGFLTSYIFVKMRLL